MERRRNSWITRTKFSHTVCHRLEPSRLPSIDLNILQERPSGLKSRAATSSTVEKSVLRKSQNLQTPPEERKTSPPPAEIPIHPLLLQIQSNSVSSRIERNPVTNKMRSVSPSPQTSLSDLFEEARSSLDHRRSATPTPRRNESYENQWFLKGSRSAYSATRSKTSRLRHSGPMKIQERVKMKKDSSWSKYLDHGARKVNALEVPDEHSVDMSKLFLGPRFDHGVHSRLHHGIYNDEPVAVKIITVPDNDENGSLAAQLARQFSREFTLLSPLHHRNVIKFVAACRKLPVYFILTEYLSKGSLRAYLHKLEHKILPLQKLVPYALDIARGMEYIHSQGIIHRDLKPENILIDQDFRLKVADFGIACKEAYCDLLADDPGTFRWMAPEMIKRKPYCRKVDVYSFGLLLWEMVAGRVPYEDMTPVQAAFAMVHKNLRPDIPEGCPGAMRCLIERCWSVQPERRPEFRQIVEVLEQFESSLAEDRTLSSVQNLAVYKDPKKGLLRQWMPRLGPALHATSTRPKPRFA